MNKERKTLKEYSVVILIFAAFSLARIIVEACLYGFGIQAISLEGVSEDLVKIGLIVFFISSLILLIPNAYVGVKGIKEAESPTSARAHIVWALILAILSLVGTITAIVDIINGFSIDQLFILLDVAVDTVLFYAYYLTAKKVAENK